MLRQFQRRFPAYVGTMPTPSGKLDWLAVIQHYGSATRLVDFSYSFYVTTFFRLNALPTMLPSGPYRRMPKFEGLRSSKIAKMFATMSSKTLPMQNLRSFPSD